jgi:hypothetical protein
MKLCCRILAAGCFSLGINLSACAQTASSDGAGNTQYVRGGDAKTGVNINAGGVVIDGGASTGRGASNISFKVAPAGSDGSGKNSSVPIAMFSGRDFLKVMSAATYDTSVTLSASDLTGGVIVHNNNISHTLTSPTASQIVDALPGVTVGMAFEFCIVTPLNGDVKLAPGPGVTIIGNRQVDGLTSGTYIVLVTNTVIPAVTIYRKS